MSKYETRRRVLFISPSIRDLYKSCAGTIARFSEGGYSTFGLIIVRNNNMSDIPDKRESIEINAERMGISKTYVVSGFDCSCVTQHNADLINRVVQSVSPSIVIMPFWQSSNRFRRILAKSALIACRGIGTIFMYDIDQKNPHYHPSIFIPVLHSAFIGKHHHPFVSKSDRLLLQPSRWKNNGSTKMAGNSFDYHNGSEYLDDNNHKKNSIHGKNNDDNNRMESFVSHRIVLLSEGIDI